MARTKRSLDQTHSEQTKTRHEAEANEVVDRGLNNGAQSQSKPDFASDGQSPENVVDEDADAGLERLGQGMQAFVTLVQGLRELGVEELDIPLPKICVLGDQSTGKSSLIEGISGIKVPRNAGTCTRCPLEIKLTTSGPGTSWKCTIFLQKSFFYEGSQMLFNKHARAQGATEARPLGPWIPQDSTEPFLFFRTSDKAEIPEALHLAQLATLNPGTDPAKFLPGKSVQQHRMQCKFSPNVIKLDISAPDVPNLSFYDLPGVINQAEVPEEEYLVGLVANLAKKYIETDHCINLLAMPMTDDPANSTASKLVQDLKAQARTIGVLTKPDRVQSGESLAQWIDILNGKKFRLGYGYYVIKNNPDPAVSHTVARHEEGEFFSQTEPWSTSLSAHSDRFGTINLQSILSKRLTQQIQTSLPQITQRVRSKTTEVVSRLNELPEPPEGNLTLKILEKIIQFERDLKKHLEGGSEKYPFQKLWSGKALSFRDTIAFSYPRLNLTNFTLSNSSSTRLPFRPSLSPTLSTRRSGVISIDSDEEMEGAQQSIPTPTPNPKKRHPPTAKTPHTSPPKRTKLYNIPKHVPEQDNSRLNSANIDRSAPYAKRFTFAEIRNIMQDAHVGLPNQVHPKATERMIKESQMHWEEPLDTFLTFTSEACLSVILDRASIVFTTWKGTQIYELAVKSCETFFQEVFSKQVDFTKRLLRIEQKKALTYHEDTMRAFSESAFTQLDFACHNARAAAYLSTTNPGWDQGLESDAKEATLQKVSEAQLGPNPWAHELRALSHVRGYYDCAFPGFADFVCKSIQAELLTACCEDLVPALKQDIGLNDKNAEQHCAVLLAVDPESERLRIELLKQKENLEKASEWLDMESR